MRLSSILLPLASILSVVSGQIGVINTSLSDIRADVDAVKNAFTAGNGPQITSSIKELDDSIATATTVVDKSPAISLLDALSLVTSINGLQTSIDQAFTVIKAQKPVVDGLGLTAAVKTSLVAQKSAVNILGNKVVEKVPSIAQNTAKTFVANLDASYASAVAAYS